MKFHILFCPLIALHPFCSSCLSFSISPILSFFISSTPYIAQLFLSQEPLLLVILGLHPLVVTPPTFYKHHHLLPCHPPLYAHDCSSKWQFFCPIMLLYLCLYFSWGYHLFFPLPFGHSYFLYLSSPYLNHCLLSSTFSCYLTSFTPHCIILLVNTSNLLFIFFVFSFSFPPLFL